MTDLADERDGLVVELDLASSVPPFEQIRQQVAGYVAAGRLATGARLPTIRAFAADLGIAPGTVARAYRELEAAGVVVTRRRTGTVVAADVAPADDAPGRAAREFVAAAHRAGLSDEDALALVRGALQTSRPRAGARLLEGELP
ncbi:MAG: GntR family transcriptional regulator [Cellulomonas sp.]|uniref:GntR family transcriptional regulator n=1 Tax=Cellulomonas gelida TaxID=1712 RepID=A0A4Y3KS68_9CELL|nr:MULTISPECIES: GntR family transcriptional regulator [Cellulomonas]MCR6648169.1 GntR family transcriptional regulator [Cellulomonas sp.]MCR6704103.1 GntR family transcriptional regulator [Cellulomonas sp.]GEA86035.1 GntR family transcriptional regulator [Cellulomonas gelida]GGL23204.1 GntR family transcriptional regulator [Cellulomonas gelida]